MIACAPTDREYWESQRRILGHERAEAEAELEAAKNRLLAVKARINLAERMLAGHPPGVNERNT